MSDTSTSMDIGRDAEEIIISHQKQTTKPEDDEDDEDDEVEVLLSPSSSPPPTTTSSTASASASSTASTIKTKTKTTAHLDSIVPSSSSSAIATSSNTIESKIGGYIYDEFKCQHNNFTGLLKVGPLGIIFLGKFLLFEWTVVIKWEDVQKVKRKHIGQPNKWTAIRIDTSGGSNGNPNPHVYDFEGFFDSHKALEVLITLHNDSMLDGAIENNPHNPRMSINQSLLSTGTGGGDLKSSGRVLLRRTNSDPSQQISTLFNFDDIPLAATAAAASAASTGNANENNNNEYNRKAMEDLQKQYYCNTNTNETIAAATAASVSAATTSGAFTRTTTGGSGGGGGGGGGAGDDNDTTSISSSSSSRTVMSAATAPAVMSCNVTSPPRRQFMRRDTSMSIATISESVDFGGGGGGNNGDGGGGGSNESVVTVDNDNIMMQQNNIDDDDDDDDDDSKKKEQQKQDNNVSSKEEKQPPQQQRLRSEWNKVYDEFIQNYTGKGEIAIDNRELQLDGGNDGILELFVNNFINDDAEYSLDSFMIDIVGDKDVKVSKWVIETVDNGDDDGDQQQRPQIFKRTIDYTHPVNAPMAPPQAKAKKEQILKKYHNCGIIIETKTFVSDVPMTDCFYVTDTICISSNSDTSDDDDETNKCKLILDIRFDIVFVKSTYFRSLIYRTTKNEMQQFMMNFTDYIITKLAVLPSLKGTEEGTLKTTKKATNNESDDSTSAAAMISPITTKSSSHTTARGVVLSSSKIATTITTNDNSNNWNWWWKILSFVLLILIGLSQIRILNEIKYVRIEMQQQQQDYHDWKQQQQQQQCKPNNVE